MNENTYENYSVLMSVYKKEQPEYLRLAMQSMFDQTVQTNDFVLICDGPLTSELDKVIEDMRNKYEEILHVICFENNRGLGYALRVGVKECKNELIARMDSDDISRPDRCEKELRVLTNHPEFSIVGGLAEEFLTSPDVIDAKRVVPETYDEIVKFAKIRNPYNHVTVMFRKADVLKAGNYPDVRYTQDYYLWVNMILADMQGYNNQEPLVWVRADSNLFRRRGGKLYRDIQLNLFKYMKDEGFITRSQYIKSCILRVGSSMAPNWLRRFMFKKVLRET